MRVLIMLFAIALATNSDAESVQYPKATFAGTFVDYQTGRGIPHAQVKLLQLTTSFWGNLSRAGMQGVPVLLGKTTTDSRGRFSIVASGKAPFEISCVQASRRMSGVTQLDKTPTQPIIIKGWKMPPPPSLEPPGGRNPRPKT